MLCLDGFEPFDHVIVDARAKAELDGRADDRCARGIDTGIALDDISHDSGGFGGSLLELESSVGERFVTQVAQFELKVLVLVEPAANAAFSYFCLARGGGDRAVSSALTARSWDGVRPSFLALDEWLMSNPLCFYATR